MLMANEKIMATVLKACQGLLSQNHPLFLLLSEGLLLSLLVCALSFSAIADLLGLKQVDILYLRYGNML